METECAIDGCGREGKQGGYCWGHRKRLARGQDMSGELGRRSESAMELLAAAALRYAEADEDEEFDRARDNLRKRAAAFGARFISEATKEALARRRAEGAKLGRPTKLNPDTVLRLVEDLGGRRRAAAALGVSRWTIWRATRG